MDHLRREVRRYYEHNTGPSAYVRLLAETIRYIAKENKSVGRRLLAISLPREGITHQPSITMRFDASFPRDVVTSLYIPEDAEDGVAYGPHFTCKEFSFRDVYARPGIFSSQGPEVPPWFQSPLVLSRRIGSNQNGDSIRPALGDDYDLRGWGMVAEYRRDAEERPTPCLIYIGPETPDLSVIEQDERYFVITNGPEEASLQVEQEWLNRLCRWLVNAGLSNDEVQTFAETIFPRATRAYVVCHLRTFFRAPLSVDYS